MMISERKIFSLNFWANTRASYIILSDLYKGIKLLVFTHLFFQLKYANKLYLEISLKYTSIKLANEL